MQNLIENKSNKNKSDKDGEEKKVRPVIKSATDLQRLKLEKLMKNPSKPIIIPEPPKEKDYMQTVPSFVRNVMGSSAGAGSGEFHVYRHLRRKEYARQKCIQAKSMREQLDEEYQAKLEKNRLEAEKKTAKKRAKRLKKKQKAKKPKTQSSDEKEVVMGDTSEEEDDEEENDGANIIDKQEHDSSIVGSAKEEVSEDTCNAEKEPNTSPDEAKQNKETKDSHVELPLEKPEAVEKPLEDNEEQNEAEGSQEAIESQDKNEINNYAENGKEEKKSETDSTK